MRASLGLSFVLAACGPRAELIELDFVPRDAVLRGEHGEALAPPLHLAPGTHVFSVERAGFASTAFALTAHAERTRSRVVRLRPLGPEAPAPGASALVVDGPSSASPLTVDNHTVNTLPARLPLAAGAHTVALRCAQAPCFQASVTLAPDTVGTVYAGPLPALLSFALDAPAGTGLTLVRPDGSERALGEAPVDTLLERTPSLRLRLVAPGSAPRELRFSTASLARLSVFVRSP